MKLLLFRIVILVVFSINGGNCLTLPDDPFDCSGVLSNALIQEIQNYKPVAQQIIDTVLSGSYKGRLYNETARFADLYPHRLPGTVGLESSIDHILQKMREYNFSNVKGEEIYHPIWRRRSESARLLYPIQKDLRMLSFGYSVGTPPEGITAQALVVKSKEELEYKKEQAFGKIIVFNQDYISYGESQYYRAFGASEAAKVGGVAALVRSITPFSMDTPHTGIMRYMDGIDKVPVAAITVEDAEMLWRMDREGYNITLSLKMTVDMPEEPGISRNAMGDLTGRTKPDEIVILSGHIDGWDVGQQVMDDASAVIMSIETLRLLQSLDLVPQRTLQALAWTCEEIGLQGVSGFVSQHEHELDKYVAAFESDTGLFKPVFLDFAGSVTGACVMREIAKLTSHAPISLKGARKYPIVASDISLLIEKGVPGVSIGTEGYETDEYFWYHHSSADTMSVLDTRELDECLAVWAVTAFVVADLSIAIPRQDNFSTTTTAVPSNSVSLTYKNVIFVTASFHAVLVFYQRLYR